MTDNPPTKIYINKIENRGTFKIKTGYYLDLFTTEPKKLLGSTKQKIIKGKNSGNLPNPEITEDVLFHCNVGNNDHQQDS